MVASSGRATCSERPTLSAVHQRWTNNIEYAVNRVAVVGSGATALALVSSLAEGGAAHVTHGATQPDVLRRATA